LAGYFYPVNKTVHKIKSTDMKSIKAIIPVLSLAGILILTTACIELKENNKGFAVVELFTSEGCSSCPPADELVEKIQNDNKNKEIYILAFHVDYWDHQGWKDKFSDPEFSKRQRQYASWLNLRTIYTPQIVVNGRAEYVGSDQGSVLKAISQGLDQPSAGTLTLRSKIADGKAIITYEKTGGEKNAQLVLALVEKSAKSKVKAGENSGRDLSHVQIVRQLLRSELNGTESISMKLPGDFTAKGWELIGFVQQKNGHITAASRLDF
jgi:hypothetical protein